MKRQRRCDHPPLKTFIAFQGKNGARVWRCSHCGKEDVWRDSWWNLGPVECRNCLGAGTLAVVCSDECRDAFKPSDPTTALVLAKLKLLSDQRADASG